MLYLINIYIIVTYIYLYLLKMNVINLCEDLIKVPETLLTYKNNLLICKDLDNLINYENIKKICYITESDIDQKESIKTNFTITNIEKFYETNYKMIFLTDIEYLKTEDLTFIIAGYHSTTCNINRILCYKYGKIIQSTIDLHTKDDLKFLELAHKKNYITRLNVYYQMHNIYRVLDKVETEYCIKYRSDEYFYDMDEFINIMKTNRKLIMTNLFFVGRDYYISDHLFGTNTIDFKRMINNLKDILERKIIVNPIFLYQTEKIFGISYIVNKYSNSQLINNQKEISLDNFYIYPCSRFTDYLVTTMTQPTSIIVNRYDKSGNNVIQRRYRVYIKKNTGYTDVNKNEGEQLDIINRIRNNIMTYEKIEDVKF